MLLAPDLVVDIVEYIHWNLDCSICGIDESDLNITIWLCHLLVVEWNTVKFKCPQSMSGIRQNVKFIVEGLALIKASKFDWGWSLLVSIVVKWRNLFLLGQEFNVVHLTVREGEDSIILSGCGALSGRNEWIVFYTEIVI